MKADIGRACTIHSGAFVGIFSQVGNFVTLNENAKLGKYTCVEANTNVPANAQVDDRGMVQSDGKILKGPVDSNKRYALWYGKCTLNDFT